MSTTTVKTNTVTHGVINATPVTSNVDADGLSSTQYVTLSANYARAIPPGYPDPNPGVAAGTAKTSNAQTIGTGARVKFFKHEAAAIVAAGGGVLS